MPPLVHVEHEVIERARCAGLAVGVWAFQHGGDLGFPLCPLLLPVLSIPASLSSVSAPFRSSAVVPAKIARRKKCNRLGYAAQPHAAQNKPSPGGTALLHRRRPRECVQKSAPSAAQLPGSQAVSAELEVCGLFWRLSLER